MFRVNAYEDEMRSIDYTERDHAQTWYYKGYQTVLMVWNLNVMMERMKSATAREE